MIIMVAALATLLYYWRIIPVVVRGFSFLLCKIMGIGEALMVKGPLVIRPYLSLLTKSELFSLMTCGLACIAGTVLVIYAWLLCEVTSQTPRGTCSPPHRLMVPEEEEPTPWTINFRPRRLRAV